RDRHAALRSGSRGRSGLGRRTRRDRHSFPVERGAVRTDARPVDVIVRARAVVLPGDHVVRAVKGDGGRLLVVGRGREVDPARVEDGTAGGHAGAVDVARVRATVLPGDQVVRAV